MPTKRCPRCEVIKDTNQFSKNRAAYDGCAVYCKPCRSEYRRNAYRDNLPRRIARIRELQDQETEHTLVCHTCLTLKDISCFFRDVSKRKGRNTDCRECLAKLYRPDRQRAWSLYTKYGLTEDEYVAMLTDQDGRCAICNCPETSSRSDKLSVDHDHATNEVRSLLCSKCNRALGLFKEDPAVLQSAIDYLLKHSSSLCAA